jgi:D-inositol-3-phosphate glycosyltransferase
MRVALISYHTSPLAQLGSSSAGGMNVYVRRLAEGLAESGVQVDVFTRREDSDTPRELEFTPGARLVQVRAGPTRSLSKVELASYTPAFARALADYTASRKLQHDVIHSHYWLSGLAAQVLRTADQPLVHMFHTLGRVKQLYQPDAGVSDPPSRQYGELRLLRSGHTLVFSTEAEVDDVERTYGLRPSAVAIIPPGVDKDRFSPRDAAKARQLLGLDDGPIILFVGRMDRAKGVDLLLHAVARLCRLDRWKSLKIVIVGGDDHHRDAVASSELSRLSAIVDEMGLERNVHFQGVIPQEDLPLYYAACDVCAVPSRYESFGMVALEALASGRPVVGFRSRGLEQTVTSEINGLLVSSGDVTALADGLARVLANPHLALRMGKAARQSVHGASWDLVVERTTDLYARLLARNRNKALRSS